MSQGIRGPYSAWDWKPTSRLGTGPEAITTDTAGNVIAHVGGTASPVATIRLPAKDAMEIAVVMDPCVPSPADIAEFLNVVRRLNSSVTWGEVEPGASVWAWLEKLSR